MIGDGWLRRGGRYAGRVVREIGGCVDGGRMDEGGWSTVESGGGLESTRFRFAGRLSDGGSCEGIGVGVEVLMRVGAVPLRPLSVDGGTALIGVGIAAGLMFGG